MSRVLPPLAVDIVLLPPTSIARQCVALSRRLGSELVLGPRAWPHLTLAMACVDMDDLPAIAAGLRALAGGTAPFDVTLSGTRAITGSSHVTAWYEARRTRPLSNLHRASVALLAPYRRARAPEAAFARVGGEQVSASSRRWVSRFEKDASGARYRPHVTLGYGTPPAAPALQFPARRLALCWLGNHCTCALVLAEARIRAKDRNRAAASPASDKARPHTTPRGR